MEVDQTSIIYDEQDRESPNKATFFFPLPTFRSRFWSTPCLQMQTHDLYLPPSLLDRAHGGLGKHNMEFEKLVQQFLRDKVGVPFR